MKENGTLKGSKYRLSGVIILMLWGLLHLGGRAAVPQFRYDIFSQEDGLPNNQIQSIYQDKVGWLWVGTSQGLSRFDGYTFVNFSSNSADSSGLQGNLVRVIKEDSNGNILVGTENGGLNVFSRACEKFLHPLEESQNIQFHGLSVNDIEEDNKGNLWLGTDYTVLVIDPAGNINAIQPKMPAVNENFDGRFVRNLQFDNKGKLWIGTNNGVYVFHPSTNEMETFELGFKPNQNREIWEIYKDDEGLLWVGTYSAGLFLVDPETKTFKHIKLEPELERTETVRSVSKGVFSDFWIGTRGGLYVYSKVYGVIGFFRHDEREPYSLSNNSVLSVYHDANGETWIGTRGGLNLLAKSKQVFHSFGALPDDNHYLNSSIVYAFWIDTDGKIWIGTEDGGINIYNPKTGTYQYLTANENNPNSISQNCIKAFLDDRHGNLWIGTYLGGIDVINLRTKEISHLKHEPSVPESLSDNRVWDLCMDKDNNIWVATSRGINKYNRKSKTFGKFPQLAGGEQVSWINFDTKGNLWAGTLDEVLVYNPEEKTIKRFPEYTRSMFEDSNNRIWAATFNKGIALYNSTSGPQKYFSENEGLANCQALCILEDNDKNLWISTTNGLSKFNPQNGLFQNFTSKDGLSNNQFCYGAACKTGSGELLFGSISGFNLFNPSEITFNDTNIPIVFTDLKIFNRSVPVSKDKKSVLKKSISETDHITLKYNQNVFSLEFAALNYVNSSNNLYSYKLEGFDKDWNEPGKSRIATYTNLDPDDYILRIKRVTPGVKAQGGELQLKITVLPPYWKTFWFLTLLYSFIFFLIFALVKLFTNREKMKNQLVLERINARKLHELDMMKLKFFTNISHEIRTPLTLILGPLEKLMNSQVGEEEKQTNLKLIHRNALNLNKLVDQLLDFRKLQSGNLKLNLSEADLVEFVRNVVNSFSDFAVEKEITLKFTSLKKKLIANFDADILEKVLNNLLSNAFKYTELGGTISVSLSLVFDSDDNVFSNIEKETQFIEVTVKDTGRGIHDKNLNRIFLRFFQSDEKNGNPGAGIGLALVKELVDLHKGKIFVSSKPGKGTKFTIHIPNNLLLTETAAEMIHTQDTSVKEGTLAQPEDNIDVVQARIMLVVEDNPDVRQFVAGHFGAIYKVLQARNGEEGWNKALENVPDVIISDILMPDVDGYEFCKRIKNDERTSHIPVILLTALHSKEHELKGLATGADDYITKPFDLSVLQVKVENLLSIRESLKEKYIRTVVLEPENVVLSSPDERFLKKALEVVENSISDSDLDIESFAGKVGVSRMQLYRKLHALTNMTVKEFIRSIRLKRAAQLLVQQKMNISEVAYEVGFKDLSHFRKCFRREYGMSAKEYIAASSENKGKK
jgi:signal transduction histidine kinase/ligand-binding sensor domain-containing protein/DNA-binding response OmpR family regulator